MIPQLSPDRWRHILKQLDPSPYNVVDVNLDPLDYKHESHFTEGRCIDIQLLSQKVGFTDLLRIMQKESELRELLSESALFFQSEKRLQYKGETKLINKQALEAMNQIKERKLSKLKA